MRMYNKKLLSSIERKMAIIYAYKCDRYNGQALEGNLEREKTKS